METHDKQFYPENVDTEIDQFLKIDDQEEITIQPSVHLVHEMRDLYLTESQVLDRAWKRLSRQVQLPASEIRVSMQANQPKKENGFMKDQALHGYKKNSGMKRLSGLGIGLVAAVVLASLFIVLNARQQSHVTSVIGSSPAKTSVTAKTTPIYGHVVYKSQKINGSFYAMSWSADGQRVAAVGSAATTNTVQIWDALTGQHRVNVALNQAEAVTTAASWSPTGELLAIPTNERVLIVNGHTGQLVTSYLATTAALATTESPASMKVGGALWSFKSIAWSSDGKSLASIYSSGGKGDSHIPGATADGPDVIQIWSASTGMVSTSLKVVSGWTVLDLSWSPDGKEIAANLESLNAVQSQVKVWNLQTQQVVFQQSINQQITGSIWQPGTHNLAFSILPDGAFIYAKLQIWNVETRQMIKSIAGIAASTMAWSPDGKEIAYKNNVGNGTAGVTLLNVNTGQKIYSYTVPGKFTSDQLADISVPAWSPDSKYIVTSESIQTQTPTQSGSHQMPPFQVSSVIKVWTA